MSYKQLLNFETEFHMRGHRSQTILEGSLWYLWFPSRIQTRVCIFYSKENDNILSKYFSMTVWMLSEVSSVEYSPTIHNSEIYREI